MNKPECVLLPHPYQVLERQTLQQRGQGPDAAGLQILRSQVGQDQRERNGETGAVSGEVAWEQFEGSWIMFNCLQDYVANYVRAYYIPEMDLEAWVEQHNKVRKVI